MTMINAVVDCGWKDSKKRMTYHDSTPTATAHGVGRSAMDTEHPPIGLKDDCGTLYP